MEFLQKIHLTLRKTTDKMPTHSPKDKTIMTEQIENNKCMSLDKKKGQLVTRAKSKRADSGNLKCFATNKLYCNLTVLCFEIVNFSYTKLYLINATLSTYRH